MADKEEDRVTVRLHPAVLVCLDEQAAKLGTTRTWVIEAALVEMFRQELPPGFSAGMPSRMWPGRYEGGGEEKIATPAADKDGSL